MITPVIDSPSRKTRLDLTVGVAADASVKASVISEGYGSRCGGAWLPAVPQAGGHVRVLATDVNFPTAAGHRAWSPPI